jgi:hypothetical protein
MHPGNKPRTLQKYKNILLILTFKQDLHLKSYTVFKIERKIHLFCTIFCFFATLFKENDAKKNRGF